MVIYSLTGAKYKSSVFPNIMQTTVTIINKLINETLKSEFVSGGSLDPLGGVGK